MKVKIGERVYDSTEEPIMLILDDRDKANIEMMLPGGHRFLSMPLDVLSDEEMNRFVDGIYDPRGTIQGGPMGESTERVRINAKQTAKGAWQFEATSEDTADNVDADAVAVKLL